MAGISLISLYSNAQPYWSIYGNVTYSSLHFLGTKNHYPLRIKTSNSTRFTIAANGDIIFNSLAGSISNRILNIDSNGKLSALSGTAIANLLINNGVGVLQKTGKDYYIPSGNLGLGIAPSPGFKLDVVGSARISQNLYIGGGIVVTDQVQAATQVKGWDVKVDHDLNVTGSSSFTGTSTFKGNIVARNGINFGNSFEIKTGVTDANGNNFLRVGPASSFLSAPPVCPGAASHMYWISNTGGYISQASNGTVNASLSMWTDWGNGTGHIEAQGTSNTGNANALLINYYCGRDVGINTGPNGGKIDLGGSNDHKVSILSPARIRTWSGDALRIENPNNNKTTFYVATDGKTVINSSNTDALTINNLATNNTVFDVKSNGYTEIKVYSPNTMPKPYGAPTNERVFTVRDMSANKDLFAITSKGLIYAREVEINLTTTFPDYVFAKDYKLKSLSEVDAYIKANQHLPNFEKGSYYEKNGINVTDLLLKQQQTIEELMLYNIELEKRLKVLEEKK